MYDFNKQMDDAFNAIKEKYSGKPKEPVKDDRPYRAPNNQMTREEFNTFILEKHGTEEQKAAHRAKQEELAAASKPVEETKEEPIHPEKALSAEMLNLKYGNNPYPGYTKAQLEAFEQNGDGAATHELQRRKIVELEKTNKAEAERNQKNLQELEAKQLEAQRQAQVEKRIEELKLAAENGEKGAVGEILRLRGKI